MKKISIVLPTYNGEKFIRESIESVINQTYQNWELIIVNDCSTDKTAEIINEYAQKDSRIRVYNNEVNKKLPASLNIGFSQATGDYYTWTSDDNLFKPNAIEILSEYLDKNLDIDLVSSRFDIIDEEGNFIKHFDKKNKRTTLKLIRGNNMGASFMYRKETAKKIGEYDTDLFCAEDYDYWSRIASTGNILYIKENLYKYRINSQSLTATKKDTAVTNSTIVQLKYAIPIMEKLGLTKKQQVDTLVKFYTLKRNKGWLKLAIDIDERLFLQAMFKYSIQLIFTSLK